MNSSYTNITLKGPDQISILNYLHQKKRLAAVSPTLNQLSVVFDQETEHGNEELISDLTRELSEYFQCMALAVMNIANSAFWYNLWNAGQFVDVYDSRMVNTAILKQVSCDCSMNAKSLIQYICSAGDHTKVKTVLEKSYLFEIDRHNDLVQLLALSDYAIGIGFENLLDLTDEVVPGITLFKITHVS
jgi:hypothetical protein